MNQCLSPGERRLCGPRVAPNSQGLGFLLELQEATMMQDKNVFKALYAAHVPMTPWLAHTALGQGLQVGREMSCCCCLPVLSVFKASGARNRTCADTTECTWGLQALGWSSTCCHRQSLTESSCMCAHLQARAHPSLCLVMHSPPKGNQPHSCTWVTCPSHCCAQPSTPHTGTQQRSLLHATPNRRGSC
jgi:hypothetical protein